MPQEAQSGQGWAETLSRGPPAGGKQPFLRHGCVEPHGYVTTGGLLGTSSAATVCCTMCKPGKVDGFVAVVVPAAVRSVVL